MHVQFYTKPGCLLCEEAEQMLNLVKEDYPLSWTTINIEENETKHEEYMLMIPVIEQDDRVLCYGNITYPDLVLLFEE